MYFLLRWILLSALALALVATTATANPTGSYIENWENPDVGVAGWYPNTIFSIASRSASGGNPGGFFRNQQFSGLEPYDVGGVVALADVTGDYRGQQWSFAFDVLYEAGVFDASVLRIRDGGSNGWVLDLAHVFPLSVWTSHVVTIDGDWTEAEARAYGWIPYVEHPVLGGSGFSFTWEQTMAAVYSVEIRISGGPTIASGIDNFIMVPEPSFALLLASGIASIAVRFRPPEQVPRLSM